MSTPSTFSFIKETPGGITIIENGNDNYFGSNCSARFRTKYNLLIIKIEDCEYKIESNAVVNINPGTGLALFAGTMSQLKTALIPVFPKAGGTALTTADRAALDYVIAQMNVINPSNT